MPEQVDVVVGVATKNEHRYVLITDLKSLHMLQSAVNNWVEDNELDFDQSMREEFLAAMKAVLDLKHRNS